MHVKKATEKNSLVSLSMVVTEKGGREEERKEPAGILQMEKKRKGTVCSCVQMAASKGFFSQLRDREGQDQKEMDKNLGVLLAALLVLISSGAKPSESARMFTLVNDCKTTIWPAITPGENFNGGGLALKPAQSVVFTAPVGWSGRIWGRTGCDFDQTGNGSCQTGSCGSALKCGASGATPASLAEFTLASTDFYDVSLVDGFNLPMVVTPVNGQGNCSAAGCDGDLRKNCPKELAVKSGGVTVGCRSACDVFNTDEYCCRGVFGNSATCQPTYYSKLFKEACPGAYSYAYDDPSSIFTCHEADYIIAFCANRNQTVCTYHHNKLICSGSNGFSSLISEWMVAGVLGIVGLLFWV